MPVANVSNVRGWRLGCSRWVSLSSICIGRAFALCQQRAYFVRYL